MSEYWVSRNKYWCKYCEIYIADDAPSRNQHEGGMRHKGNKERFVRNLYKQGERKKKDEEEEKREMARIERAASASFAQDVAEGRASSSKTQLPKPSPAEASRKPKAQTGGFDNYSTAQSLGYTDPDEEKRLAELERKRSQGLVGEWEVVPPPPPPLVLKSEEEDSKGDVTVETFVPEKVQQEENDDDARGFKLRKRKLGAGFDELWDPGDIQVKLKTPKTDANEEGKLSLADALAPPSSAAVEKPKWTPKGWKKALDPADTQSSSLQGDTPPLLNSSYTSITKSEERLVQEPSTSSEATTIDFKAPAVKEDDELPTPPSAPVFRKRKIPGKR